MAFVISPTRGLPGASSDQYLGIFNETTNGKSSNNVIAIELDIHIKTKSLVILMIIMLGLTSMI